ncbi:MAG: nucleotidyltransferase domain-containing protein [Syntrophomonadaceae bacterium]|nr:nucleotidyltransferase domain-containing protein [Syntrophomonadaceae bacterium]
MDKHKEDLIIEYLTKELGAILIILFGSAITDRTHVDSDIDIAFISKNKYDSLELYTCAQDLSALLKKEVDLIDLAQVSPVIQVQIISKGRIIYDENPQFRMEFFILAFKKYARLNEEREMVLNKIKERGRVYGK